MLYKYMDVIPEIHETAYVAPTAAVIGDVAIGAGASVWFGAVLRGDIDVIRIGAGSSIQDNVTIHVTGGIYPTIVGEDVVVGHGAVLHGCIIENRALIGMGATILDNAIIGSGSIVAAGALVLEGQQVPPNSLVAGVPATVRRQLKAEDKANMDRILTNYERETSIYRNGAVQPILTQNPDTP